jgi:hypothetical protein
MISTVTASTVSAQTTAAAASPLALVATLVLIFLLVLKELVSCSDNPRMKNLIRVLEIAILPFLLAFIWLVVTCIAEVLN